MSHKKYTGLLVLIIFMMNSQLALAAQQCFYQAGTYGDLTVTQTGSGCGTFLNYGGIMGVWLGNSGVSENCRFDLSPAAAADTVEVRMTAHSVLAFASEEAVFSLNGAFVAIVPSDIDNSYPTGGVPLAAGTGGALDPTVGGVTADQQATGGDGRGTVRFSGAPANVNSIDIQHNMVLSDAAGTIYEVCADDGGVVVEPGLDSIATFAVTKDFSDNNPTPVEVTLSCNTGLPLSQSFVISDDQSAAPNFSSVTFLVTSFADGTLDCTVTETPVDGYTSSYLAAGDSENDDDDPQSPGCHFFNVNFEDANSCSAINTLESVFFNLTKKWEFESDSNFTKEAEIEIFIENFRGGPSGELQDHSGQFTIGDETKNFFVYPNYGTPQTRIRAIEFPSGSAVESDQGCADWITIEVGDEPVSCTITNTVFFEGIPTLSQYGLAIMALLVLGIGFIGFRRFA